MKLHVWDRKDEERKVLTHGYKVFMGEPETHLPTFAYDLFGTLVEKGKVYSYLNVKPLVGVFGFHFSFALTSAVRQTLHYKNPSNFSHVFYVTEIEIFGDTEHADNPLTDILSTTSFSVLRMQSVNDDYFWKWFTGAKTVNHVDTWHRKEFRNDLYFSRHRAYATVYSYLKEKGF